MLKPEPWLWSMNFSLQLCQFLLDVFQDYFGRCDQSLVESVFYYYVAFLFISVSDFYYKLYHILL